MAENKKSFVAYCDWEKVFEMLTDEEAGKVTKHLFAYVNDREPVLEDRLLKIVFEPIKLQLKRDLKKYESIREKRIEAGKLGGRPPKKQTEAKKANGFFEKQTKAKKPVTVTVNDTVTVTDINTLSNERVENAPEFNKSLNPDFKKFNNWIKENAPFCSNSKNFPHQITEAEFIKLKQKYNGQQIADIVEKIENRKDLRKRYSNLYSTVNNWLKKDLQNG